LKKEDYYQLKILKWTFRVPKDLLYNENDCWTKIEGPKARVGITDFLQSMATDIIFVEFKDVGTEIEQLDEVASFESTKAILDLISPVSGVIVEVNEKLSERPELVNQDPYGEGWFAVLKLKNFESDRENLLDAQKRKVESEKEKLGKQK
jgi:glycine cleavage system H protein